MCLIRPGFGYPGLQDIQLQGPLSPGPGTDYTVENVDDWARIGSELELAEEGRLGMNMKRKI